MKDDILVEAQSQELTQEIEDLEVRDLHLEDMTLLRLMKMLHQIIALHTLRVLQWARDTMGHLFGILVMLAIHQTQVHRLLWTQEIDHLLRIQETGRLLLILETGLHREIRETAIVTHATGDEVRG